MPPGDFLLLLLGQTGEKEANAHEAKSAKQWPPVFRAEKHLFHLRPPTAGGNTAVLAAH